MDILPTDGAGAPTRWMLVFRRRSTYRWVNWLVPGEFKHVRAYGFVAECDAYIFFDPGWGRIVVSIVRGKAFRIVIRDFAEDAVVVAFDSVASRPPRLFFPFCCTTAIAALIGIRSGALLPDRLFHQCLRSGAQIVYGQAASTTDHAHRPAPAG